MPFSGDLIQHIHAPRNIGEGSRNGFKVVVIGRFQILAGWTYLPSRKPSERFLQGLGRQFLHFRPGCLDFGTNDRGKPMGHRDPLVGPDQFPHRGEHLLKAALIGCNRRQCRQGRIPQPCFLMPQIGQQEVNQIYDLVN